MLQSKKFNFMFTLSLDSLACKHLWIEDSLPEIALSDASKLALMLYLLFWYKCPYDIYSLIWKHLKKFMLIHSIFKID